MHSTAQISSWQPTIESRSLSRSNPNSRMHDPTTRKCTTTCCAYHYPHFIQAHFLLHF
ncbi:hypothetical protein RHMOL_Rhmol12G0127500 [Rhododendron molle]|uniref:Uncharacterized protein n=1 Tax=Rhododendron molle TaxID=49168 RepID=A0ACC0LIZ4_RHOML|nr:hypothetical protein RHMOL_Rhmol12G0127500 [Rhododendron molle]